MPRIACPLNDQQAVRLDILRERWSATSLRSAATSVGLILARQFIFVQFSTNPLRQDLQRDPEVSRGPARPAGQGRKEANMRDVAFAQHVDFSAETALI